MMPYMKYNMFIWKGVSGLTYLDLSLHIILCRDTSQQNSCLDSLPRHNSKYGHVPTNYWLDSLIGIVVT
jgi:hypothetical protein